MQTLQFTYINRRHLNKVDHAEFINYFDLVLHVDTKCFEQNINYKCGLNYFLMNKANILYNVH